MKEMNDEELQRMFEDGKFSPKTPLNADGKAYLELFEALNKEPEGGLPYDFAANVTRNVQAQQKREGELKYNLAAFAIFLGVIVIVCGIMSAYGVVNSSTLFKYKWVLILLPVVFTTIQYFDQRLVKARMFKRSYKP